jgi:hypothetical protein
MRRFGRRVATALRARQERAIAILKITLQAEILRIWRTGFGFYLGKTPQQRLEFIQRLFLVWPHRFDGNSSAAIKVGGENFEDTCRGVTFTILMDEDGAPEAYHALHKQRGRPRMQSKLVDDFGLPLHRSEL